MIRINRRHFIGSLGLTALDSALTGAYLPTIANNSDSQPGPVPSTAQKAFMDLGFGMFIHFGINTFYDKEWSDGTLDISKFRLDKPDTDQWCRVAKDAGMKYIVLVTKHHDGFCNWPSKFTKYSVEYTPYGGDLVSELVNSAQKHNLKVGFYYSLWDQNKMLHNENEYLYIHDYLIPQLDELLSNYGEITELWFDGFWKKQQSGWKEGTDYNDPEEFIQHWRLEGAFRWQMDYVYQYIKQIQPDCIVMNNPTSKFKTLPLHPVDAVCAERGTELTSYKNNYPWLGKNTFFPLQIETTMSVKGNEKFPNGNWFWHEWDNSVASTEQINNWLTNAKNQHANLLLNCGPMSNGKLRAEDVQVLSSLRS